MKPSQLRGKHVLLLTAILMLAYAVIFILPNGAEQFALSPEKFYSGEFYRIFTYSFAHVSHNHLLENLLGLGIVAGIATELKTPSRDFSVVYFLAGILAALPLFFLFNLTLLGASAAIFGAFGFVAPDSRKFKIKPEYFILPVAILIFGKTLYSALNCGVGCEDFLFSAKQDSGHFLGLIFGLGMFAFLRKCKPALAEKRRYVLRGLP